MKQRLVCILLVEVDTRRIIETNEALGELLGYTREELLSMTVYGLLAHDRDDVDAAIVLHNDAETLAIVARDASARKHAEKVAERATLDLGAFLNGQRSFGPKSPNAKQPRRLSRKGYQVHSAPDAEKAIEIHRTLGVRVDLLFTDVVLPEMSGPELADVLRERDPGIRVLSTSGYTDEMIERYGILETSNNFLRKPYSLVALNERIRDVLDNPPSI
jgi:CheY-like chemotaxis protein